MTPCGEDWKHKPELSPELLKRLNGMVQQYGKKKVLEAIAHVIAKEKEDKDES